MSDRGHIELERSVGSIVVGERHRHDAGDLTPLVDSMKRVGLLQPVTVTPDGVLICGFRRLEAAKRLGWNTLRVWVRSGISDELTRLLAERDENVTHKPLSTMESTALYKEMKALLQEDANRRMKAHQFGAESGNPQVSPARSIRASRGRRPAGSTDRQRNWSPVRRRTTRLEQILEIERIAANRELPKDLRQVAEDELEAIRNGGAVDPGYQKVKATQRLSELMRPGDDTNIDDHLDDSLKRSQEERRRRVKENRARREAEAANRKRSTRSFALKWAELDGWTKRYDVDQIACELKPDDWALFLRVIDETSAFAEAVALARDTGGTPES